MPAWRNGLRSGCQVVELDGGKAGGKVKWYKNAYVFWRAGKGERGKINVIMGWD